METYLNNIINNNMKQINKQITAAEEAAINEVKQGFDKARKEVGNG